ncbi:hypothetical protein P3S68_009613 [Capsicum galapagoense]
MKFVGAALSESKHRGIRSPPPTHTRTAAVICSFLLFLFLYSRIFPPFSAPSESKWPTDSSIHKEL